MDRKNALEQALNPTRVEEILMDSAEATQAMVGAAERMDKNINELLSIYQTLRRQMGV